MTFERVTATMVHPLNDKEFAKTIFDFFLWQYTYALQIEIATRCELDSYKAANEAARREYEKDDNMLGWGPPTPYNEHAINMKKLEVERTKKNLEEAKALLEFVRDRFLDKFL